MNVGNATLGGCAGAANVNVSLRLIECCRRHTGAEMPGRHRPCSNLHCTAEPCDRCPNRGQSAQRARECWSRSVHETRREPRALCLLAGKARDTPGARARRDRARRHSRRAQRRLHPCARPQRRSSGSSRRHPGLRAVRPRDQRGILPRPVDQYEPAHHRQPARNPRRRMHRHGCRRDRAERYRRTDRPRAFVAAARRPAAKFRAHHWRAGAASGSAMAGRKPDRRAHARGPPACRGRAREASSAALYGAPRPARSGRL